MTKRITYCSECDNVVADTRKRHPATWRCSKFPLIEGGGFVVPDIWVTDEPFMKCKDINGGACPLFTPKEAQDEQS